MAKRLSRRRNDPLFDVKKENGIVAFFRILAIIVLAYFSGTFFDLLLVRISQMPHGPLWDQSFVGPFFFVMMVLTCCLISIPYWMKEWDPTLRSWSMYTVVFIVGYAVFDGSGVIDPGYPLKWLVTNAQILVEKYSHYHFR